jgi:hypothetical protein
MLIDVARRRFTADEFWRMAEAGLFLERPRVELIDGEVVEMTPLHREPAGSSYRAVERVGRGGTVAPAAFPYLALSVDALLG